MFRGIAPTERGGYSLREMAQQHGPFEYFNSLLDATAARVAACYCLAPSKLRIMFTSSPTGPTMNFIS